MKWATAPGRIFARVWAVIYAAGDAGESTPVIWMPAHTAAWQVGSALRSDGVPLTQENRDANEAADKFAKQSARGRRVTEGIRASILESASEVRDMAVWIARVTLEANAFKGPDGACLRDSQADRALRRKRLPRKRPRVQEPQPEVSLTERLLKVPRLAAVKARILARSAG